MYLDEDDSYYSEFEQIDSFLYVGHIDKMNAIFKDNADTIYFEDNFMEYLESKQAKFRVAWNKNDPHCSALAKQCALLSHLTLDHQLHILDKYIFPNIRIDHIELLLQNHDAPTIMQTNVFDICVAYHFHKQEFAVIDALNAACGTNVLSLDKKDGCIYTDYPSAAGNIALLKTVKFHFPLFYPYHDIIYAYTPEKEQYLLSKGIDLPHIDDAIYITEKILVNLEVYEDLDDQDKIYFNHGVQYYTKLKMYAELQEQLPHHQKKTMKSKI